MHCLSPAMVTSLECNWLELHRVGLAPCFFSPSPSLSLTDSFEARQEQGWPIYRASLSLPCIHLKENKELLFCSDLGRQALMPFLRTGLKIYCYFKCRSCDPIIGVTLSHI